MSVQDDLIMRANPAAAAISTNEIVVFGGEKN
eukprot:CAMPEP_0185574908 /NCGR_PEP_ID=MMETSP0434-20130131/6249_1 /TAXON_ID=626734 ORGANISM="Favella taraikaensis, Strain Fe Narragansett Bay" /NCGR_SAMPLE_ID=MMETSP0434 /ASSEMBLY_ACC=CAM_ASM_000379 /LENGTH=31 /DNA_ID= /DNA_START= /DNA_END= /DNA_ORIENTATION=